MKINACILSLSFAAAIFATSARADDPVAAGSTIIDLGGDVAVAGITGGMADPVPLFAGDNGPAIFVLGAPLFNGDALEDQLNNSVKQGFMPPGTAVHAPMGSTMMTMPYGIKR